MSQGKVRIYGAGGLGNNIAKTYVGQKDIAGFATPLVSFIDTSRSNLDASIPNEAIFVLEGTDGSGKVRRENHQAIADSIKQILLAQQMFNYLLANNFQIIIDNCHARSQCSELPQNMYAVQCYHSHWKSSS